jgi:hypothetical protein
VNLKNRFSIIGQSKPRKRMFVIQRRGAATFLPIINMNAVLGNDHTHITSLKAMLKTLSKEFFKNMI